MTWIGLVITALVFLALYYGSELGEYAAAGFLLVLAFLLALVFYVQ